MGTQNQNQDRQAQGAAGQTTPPQDPKLNPDRDDVNQIKQRTSDQGQGRSRSAADNRSPEAESGGNPTETSTRPSGKPASNQGQMSPKSGAKD